MPPDDRPTNVRYWVLGSLCAAAAITYLQRQLMAVVASPLAADLKLDDRQLGSAMASFFVGYALFQIPSGWLADRWGSRACLTLLAALWSVATAGMALVDSYTSLMLLWFTVGSAQAGVFPCAASSIRKWLPTTRRALASGMLASCMSLGGAASAYLAGRLIGELDWRALFVLFALPGLVWSAGFGWWFRNTPADHAGVNPAELGLIEEGRPAQQAPTVDDLPSYHVWLAMLSSPAMWAICGQQFFRAAAYIFFATWFPTYLAEARGVSLSEAGQLTSLPLVAVVLGSPLGGALSDALWTRTHNTRLSRCVLASVCMGLCACLIVAAYFVDNAELAVIVISLGAFCAAIGGVSSYAITMDLGGRHVATVFSVMNMCGNLGAALFPTLVGWLVTETGRWDEILLLFASIYVAAAICWALVNPNRPIFPANSPASASS